MHRFSTLVSLIGSAATMLGAYLHALFAHQPSNVSASNAGLGLAIVGLCTAIIAPFFGWLQDRRKDARARWEAELRLREMELRTEGAETRLSTLEVGVPANEARIAGIDGKVEGALDILRRNKTLLNIPPPINGRPRATLVIVDDDPATARALMTLFTVRGFSCTHAATLKDGIDLLAKRPHWMIVDLAFPDGGDGLDLLRKARALGVNTKVMILTGVADPDRVAQAMALVPDAFFKKPADFDAMVGVMLRVDDPVDEKQPPAP